MFKETQWQIQDFSVWGRGGGGGLSANTRVANMSKFLTGCNIVSFFKKLE